MAKDMEYFNRGMGRMRTARYWSFVFILAFISVVFVGGVVLSTMAFFQQLKNAEESPSAWGNLLRTSTKLGMVSRGWLSDGSVKGIERVVRAGV